MKLQQQRTADSYRAAVFVRLHSCRYAGRFLFRGSVDESQKTWIIAERYVGQREVTIIVSLTRSLTV